MQEVDAARRLAILRGETPPPIPEPEPEIDPSDKNFARRDRDSTTGFTKRKRKRAGEDDTDFEMRMVREKAEIGEKVAGELAMGATGGPKKREVDIIGKDGHIDLVGAPPPTTGNEKNPEHEREVAKKKREMEDQYTMRFSNAAGRDGFSAGSPWYAKSGGRSTSTIPTKEELDAEVGMEAPTKDVWGNEDPKRKLREAQRLSSTDPLAMMKIGAKKVREIEKERRKENDERQRELKELRREERHREKRRRKERHEDDNGRSRDRDTHRSHRSERSQYRHHSREREERRHRNRDERDIGTDRDRDRYKGRDCDRPSRSHGDREDRGRHSHRNHDDNGHGT